MIKSKRCRQRLCSEDACFRSIVTRCGNTGGRTDKDDADRMLTGIPERVGVDIEQLGQGDIEAGFLLCLAPGCRFDRLPVLNETAGQCPAHRQEAALDQNNTVGNFDDRVYRRYRIAISCQCQTEK